MKANTNSDVNVLKNEYKNYLSHKREEEIRSYSDSTGKKYLIATIALFILGLITIPIFIGIALLAGAAYCGYKYYQLKNNPEKYLEEINLRYNNELNTGYQIIDKCAGEWQHINSKINEFDNKQKYLVA